MARIKELGSNFICPSWTVMANSYWKHREKYFYGIKWFKSFHKYRCKVLAHKACSSLPLSINICPFKAPHGLLGIVIHKDVSIGEGCTIFQFVTIGRIEDTNSKRYGVPTIGKNVFIGAGATIIGGIRIGDNVKIGAGCTISEDIEDNVTVVVQHPRIIVRDLLDK